MFEQALLAGPRGSARTMTFAASMGVQMVFLTAALIVPLFLVEGPSVARLSFLLMAPPPPPPPPAPMKLVEVPANVARSVMSQGRVFAPNRVRPIAPIVDQEIPEAIDVNTMVRSGVTGGMPGSPTGVLGGTGSVTLAPPPAEPVKPAKVQEPVKEAAPVTRIRQGGDVLQAKLIHKVVPAYPALAKAARIQGTVRLQGILSREGRIIQLQLLSGHPLLAQAALDAVRQWVYQPTLLNGEPVEVVAPIDVHFTLSN